MNKRLLLLSVSFMAGFSLSGSVSVSAQSLLQNTTNQLQPQAGQAQNTNNSQPQTSNVQSSTSSPLNQSGQRPLGVVSDPKQTTPDAVVLPSNTLKTDVTPNENQNTLQYVAFGSLVIALAGLAYYLKTKPKAQKFAEQTPKIYEPKPELIQVPKIKKPKRSRRQRKKTTKRN